MDIDFTMLDGRSMPGRSMPGRTMRRRKINSFTALSRKANIKDNASRKILRKVKRNRFLIARLNRKINSMRRKLLS